MSKPIDYGNLMHDAMRGLIRKVLDGIAANGLPGEHHFFITFDTMHPDVELADWLSDRYPEEMTIVIQHWFDNLDVGDDGFAITLNFGDSPEPLYVPFDAIRTFVDPSVEFGLRFETQELDVEEMDEDEIPHDAEVKSFERPDEEPATEEAAPAPTEVAKEAEIVSLDKFRK